MREPEAAVAILHAREPYDSVLLMRRADHASDPWSGHWSFPGGRREACDEDLLDTALRELREECGVELRRGDLESALEPATARRRSGPHMRVAPFVFRVPEELAAVPDLCEAMEARWLALSVVRDPAQHVVRVVPGVPPEMLFPTVPLPGMPLWGFTYRLITEWLGLGKDGSGADYVRRVASEVGMEDGAFPVRRLVERLGEPWPEVPPVNVVEVGRNRIRVTDLEFREVSIEAMP